MNQKTKETFRRLTDEVLSYESIDPDQIPNIDIYMDQLTTFMDRKLREQTRDPEHDKVLTKTMINNYTKNDLLPPPVKKKYTKDHLILLIYIFYYKNNLSISDINTLIAPLKEQFGEGETPGLDTIYRETLARCTEETPQIKEDLERMFELAEHSFSDAPAASRNALQQFAFLSMLEYDVYIKQAMIERFLDDIAKTEKP